MRSEKKTLRAFTLVASCLAVFFGVGGCGSDDSSAELEREARQAAARRAERATERRQVRLAHRAEAREEADAQEATEAEETSECDPSYTGACLDPYASDYDCEGGSGDGPEYTGPVTVVGEDHYGLDADSDGTGCES